ncbi:MAG: ribonuclease P protein component [Tildeniella torsiva UHER 1998/13D]|nr:ribonuclease P protein component [Tildeniella torsiva UHER 1998/13D]
MLPKHHRLRRSREFSQVYRQGRKAVSAHLLVRAWSLTPVTSAKPVADSAHSSRIGIVVSLKVHKRAVVRNRLKRRVRAALRTLLPRLHSSQWIVISLKPEAAECEYGEFLRELEQLFTKLEVLHGHS